MLAAEIAVAAALGDHPTLQNVAVAVAIRCFPEGAPAAHIAPARIKGNHGAQFCFFHHGHIDGHVWTFGEGFPFQPQKLQVGGVLLQGRPAAAHHLRVEAV